MQTLYLVTRGIPYEPRLRWQSPLTFNIAAATSPEAGRVATELARAVSFHRGNLDEAKNGTVEHWAKIATDADGQRIPVA